MSCYIREVHPEDVQLVMPLIRRIFPEAKIRINEEDLVFIAIYDSRIVGFLHLSERERYFVLKGIGVDERYRNTGNGTVLMGKVDEIARTTEKRILLKVRCTNPAVLLYERFGFCLKGFGPTYTLVKNVNN